MEKLALGLPLSPGNHDLRTPPASLTLVQELNQETARSNGDLEPRNLQPATRNAPTLIEALGIP